MNMNMNMSVNSMDMGGIEATVNDNSALPYLPPPLPGAQTIFSFHYDRFSLFDYVILLILLHLILSYYYYIFFVLPYNLLFFRDSAFMMFSFVESKR